MAVALVLAGGDPPHGRILEGTKGADLVIAADSGVRIARTHGLSIHAVVGDLDSVSTGDVAWAKAEGAEILEVPRDKDFTDLELAMERAAADDIDRIVVVGIEGGRIDHELGNWAVLCADRAPLVEVLTSGGSVVVLHGETTNRIELTGNPGDVVSILARNGEATGVTTTGLRWPLEQATLEPTSSVGVSNEIIGTEATIELKSGTVLVARPEQVTHP